MFLLICGENTVDSRNHLAKLKHLYKVKNSTIIEVPARELQETLKNEQVMTLFGDPIIYITEGLFGQFSKQKKKVAEEIKLLDADPNFKIIDWEDKSAYDLKLKAPSFQVKEFKADKTVFDFQELCIPGNKQPFIDTLTKLIDSNDPIFLFTMLNRHVRTMILLKNRLPAGNMHPFVKQKAERQAQRWDNSKLIAFYEGLTRIDTASKTSASPFDMRRSLEILACYYL